MSLIYLSDLHLTTSSEDKKKFFLQFIKKCLDDDSITDVFLLGDIFDLLFGKFKENITAYHYFFEGISSILDKKRNIYFLEGNHDFHLKELFDYYL